MSPVFWWVVAVMPDRSLTEAEVAAIEAALPGLARVAFLDQALLGTVPADTSGEAMTLVFRALRRELDEQRVGVTDVAVTRLGEIREGT